MTRKVLLVQAHPDAGGGHFGDALAKHYADGAASAGHEVRVRRINEAEFPLLTSQAEWRDGPVPPAIADAQQDLSWSEHLVFFYPLWMGDMPALLKAWIEQVMRPGFAFSEPKGKFPEKLLGGRSARIVVTMGMPGLFYRIFYRAHSVHSFRRNILRFAGIRPVRLSLVGLVEGGAARRDRWLDRMTRLGQAAR